MGMGWYSFFRLIWILNGIAFREHFPKHWDYTIRRCFHPKLASADFMNWKSLFDIRSTNAWILALSIAANLLWSFFTLIVVFYVLDIGKADIGLAQVGLLLAEFIGTLIIGWFCGWLAFDDRGATYGFIGALGSVFMILLYLLASGGIAILLSIAALAGGFNGGAITRYRGKSK
jgi:hypothetical protein